MEVAFCCNSVGKLVARLRAAGVVYMQCNAMQMHDADMTGK